MSPNVYIYTNVGNVLCKIKKKRRW